MPSQQNSPWLEYVFNTFGLIAFNLKKIKKYYRQWPLCRGGRVLEGLGRVLLAGSAGRCVCMRQLPRYRHAVCVILVFVSWSAGRGDIPDAVSHASQADNAPASRDPGG